MLVEKEPIDDNDEPPIDSGWLWSLIRLSKNIHLYFLGLITFPFDLFRKSTDINDTVPTRRSSKNKAPLRNAHHSTSDKTVELKAFEVSEEDKKKININIDKKI